MRSKQTLKRIAKVSCTALAIAACLTIFNQDTGSGIVQVYATSEDTPDPTDGPYPTGVATATATAEPTAPSTAEPTVEPTAPSTAEPTVEPTAPSTAEPTVEPTSSSNNNNDDDNEDDVVVNPFTSVNSLNKLKEGSVVNIYNTKDSKGRLISDILSSYMKRLEDGSAESSLGEWLNTWVKPTYITYLDKLLGLKNIKFKIGEARKYDGEAYDEYGNHIYRYGKLNGMTKDSLVLMLGISADGTIECSEAVYDENQDAAVTIFKNNNMIMIPVIIIPN